MNEGAVQRRVAGAHLPDTVPPLCRRRSRLLLRCLPRSRLSSWASTSLLWGSKIEHLLPVNFASLDARISSCTHPWVM